MNINLNMSIRYGTSIVINILVIMIIMLNYHRLKSVVKNRLLILFLALVLVFADIIIKSILGNENIFAKVITSIIYPLSMSIFIYLILSRKHKV